MQPWVVFSPFFFAGFLFCAWAGDPKLTSRIAPGAGRLVGLVIGRPRPGSFFTRAAGVEEQRKRKESRSRHSTGVAVI